MQCGAVGVSGVCGAAETTRQVCSGDVEIGPATELRLVADGVEDVEPGRGTVSHRDDDGPVRLDDGGRIVAQQFAVKEGNLPPVGVYGVHGCGVARRDGGVKLIGAGPTGTQGSFGGMKCRSTCPPAQSTTAPQANSGLVATHRAAWRTF